MRPLRRCDIKWLREDSFALLVVLRTFRSMPKWQGKNGTLIQRHKYIEAWRCWIKEFASLLFIMTNITGTRIMRYSHEHISNMNSRFSLIETNQFIVTKDSVKLQWLLSEFFQIVIYFAAKSESAFGIHSCNKKRWYSQCDKILLSHYLVISVAVGYTCFFKYIFYRLYSIHIHT